MKSGVGLSDWRRFLFSKNLHSFRWRTTLIRILSLHPSLGFLGLATTVLFANMAAAQASSPSLADQVHTIVASHHGNVALFAENLKTRETVAISADTPVQTASVIKLAILYEALEQVRSGKAHFDDKISLTKTDQVPGSGVPRVAARDKDGVDPR